MRNCGQNERSRVEGLWRAWSARVAVFALALTTLTTSGAAQRLYWLGSVGGDFGAVYRIADNGVAVGYIKDASYTDKAFVWDPVNGCDCCQRLVARSHRQSTARPMARGLLGMLQMLLANREPYFGKQVMASTTLSEIWVLWAALRVLRWVSHPMEGLLRDGCQQQQALYKPFYTMCRTELVLGWEL